MLKSQMASCLDSMLGEDGKCLGSERVPPIVGRRVPLQELVRKLEELLMKCKHCGKSCKTDRQSNRTRLREKSHNSQDFSPGHAAVSCAGAALPGEAFERSTGGAAAGAPRETWMTLTIGGGHSDSEIGISNLAD